ncbi:MAG: T9SS type A sorting domain-containing protein, partial [Bacteroidales bacterium]|nr:T9SS type A sorting domain-containing protein [Bacteroidales bacterium]
ETQGVDITVQIKIVWSVEVEDNGFNRDRCFISHYHGGKWDTVPAGKAIKEGTQYYVMRDSITSFSPFAVMSEESSGTPTLYTEEVFEMYPNPVDQTLTLQIEKTGNYLEIYNIAGTKVMQRVIDNKLTEIDLNNFKSGVYFVSYNGMIEKLIVR